MTVLADDRTREEQPAAEAGTRRMVALVGPPNCGKSTLFNGLTGGRSKVANYPGATVEVRAGAMTLPSGREITLYDLPGIYGTASRSKDADVALEVIGGQSATVSRPDLLLVLVEAATLRTHLHTVLQAREFGLPMIVVVNMIDLAERDGLEFDLDALSREIGVPVVACRATRSAGRAALVEEVEARLDDLESARPNLDETIPLKTLQAEARRMAKAAIVSEPLGNMMTRKLDRVLLHPFAGPLILFSLLFLVFQAVFSWATPLMDGIEAGMGLLQTSVATLLPEGWLADLLTDGIIAGVGSVIVFLPQIVILFSFILLLEASGYMARAAFLMDELMMRVGLNGRAFIPLLSSFACAIPGIMAARVIGSERDRITTILIAPLMTCSARLPVYTLLIAAFIPPTSVGPFGLQGLVMFGLYMFAVISGVTVAFVLKRTLTAGGVQPLILELPSYKVPNAGDFFAGLWMRASAFLRRAGTIILATSIGLWFLASYPASAGSLRETFAGQIGALIEPILAPIGFNLEIAIALIPGFAAREVAVGALGTVYAVQGGEENIQGLAAVLQNAWSLPTGLAFIAWYVFAPQCFATLATMRRETNSWAWTGFGFAYLLGLAYIAAGATYWIASALV
ncbi:ferrous iron transport protein B [Henriciella aquimarina]|uniref:ferrous iron transport protein B n=1 Tax=Henriciella aquimarina TaxID=545261 RepID=UPI001F1C1704|nr:ferrous iron transport protein B [Henriciella aquimarina]